MKWNASYETPYDGGFGEEFETRQEAYEWCCKHTALFFIRKRFSGEIFHMKCQDILNDCFRTLERKNYWEESGYSVYIREID